MNPLNSIASDFGPCESAARRDARTLSSALGQPVMLWFDGSNWRVLPAVKAIGKNLDFEHELIQIK